MRCSATRRPPASHTAAVTLMLSCSALAIAPRNTRLASSRVMLIGSLSSACSCRSVPQKAKPDRAPRQATADRLSNLHLAAQLDDPVGRDAEEFRGIERVVRHL